MKIYRILGILWLVGNSYGAFEVAKMCISHGRVSFNDAVWFLLVVIAIIASIFLIRGATWARFYIGLFAALLAFISFDVTAQFGSYTVSGVIWGIFALVSAILLLIPRRYVAA